MSRPSLRSRLATALLGIPATLALLATSLPAQVPFAQHSQALEIPSFPGEYDRLVVGDLDGDHRPDVTVQLDSRLFTVFSIGSAPRVVGMPGPAGGWTVHDVAAIPRAQSGEQDALLIAAQDGLREGSFDGTTHQLSQVWVLGGPWVNAQRVVCDRVGSDLMIAGLGPDGHTVLIGRESAGSYAHIASFDAGADVIDLAILDWLGDGTRRIVATTSAGLLLFDLAGAPQTLAASAIGSHIARLRDGESHDKLAFVAPVGGTWELTVHDKDGVEPAVAMSFLVDAPNGIACADLEGDGTTDLVITQRESYAAHVLLRQTDWNDPPTHFFDADPAHRIDFETVDDDPPSSPNEAGPLFADLDNDGRADLAVGLTSLGRVVAVYGIGIPEDEGDSGILTTEVDSGFEETSQYSGYYGTDRFVLLLKVDAGSHDVGMTHVDLDIFSATASGGVWNVGIDPVLMRHSLHGVTANHSHVIPTRLASQNYVWANGAHYFLRVRFVEVEGDEIVKWSRDFILGLTAQTWSGQPADKTRGIAGYMDALKDLEQDPEQRINRPGRTRIGGIIPPPKIPPPPPPPEGSLPPGSSGVGPPTETWN